MIVFKVERAKFYDLLDGLISYLDGLMVDLETFSDGGVLEVNFGSGDPVLFTIYDEEREENEND